MRLPIFVRMNQPLIAAILFVVSFLTPPALSAEKNKGGQKEAASKTVMKITSGVFTGIEEGDYSHWKMKTDKGEEVTYFILKPDAAIEVEGVEGEHPRGRR
jgi:hypothetical protein